MRFLSYIFACLAVLTLAFAELDRFHNHNIGIYRRHYHHHYHSSVVFPSSAAVASTSIDGASDPPASTAEANPHNPPPKPYGGSAGKLYHSPAFVPRNQSLHPHLPQNRTNGASQLGTSRAPKLPHYLGNSSTSPGKPWGNRTAKHTNQYNDIPDTGVTRYYDFTVSQQNIAPDGFTRLGMVVNGAFPGPTIEANWGDWFEITVHNNLTNEGTSIHWHGLLQQETPWFDGVPSVTNCPIAPGGTLTYKFRADLYGSSWWHSHYSAQYADGIFGAMIIYGPHDNAEYDDDLGPILLTDYYHTEYYKLIEQVMAPASENLAPPVSNNNLINGKMNYPCAKNTTGCVPNAGISKFAVQSGKSYRLRLINAGAEGMQKFSIDGYQLKVIANDFVPIVPYSTDVVTLGIGQRTDVVIEANGKSTDLVWMRSTLGPSAFAGGCTLNDGISPEAVAVIYYENANSSALPKTTSSIPESVITTCENDALDLTTPYYSFAPTTEPQYSHNISITFQSNGTNDLFYMNNSTFRADYNDPTLLEAYLGNYTFRPESNVYNTGQNQSVRIVLYNYAPTGAHPMHMHGHNVWILAQGSGTWNGSITNAPNPQRRDVQLLPNAVNSTVPSYIVLQVNADNPGVWPLHCHIAWHVSAGLYVNILERPQDIRKDRTIPSTIAQTCRDWSLWTGTNIPDEIDSGL